MTESLRRLGRRPGAAVVLNTLLVLAIAALVLTRSSGTDIATATDGGPEMLLNIPDGDCDDPDRPTTCHVALGARFTLSVEVVTAPAQGYILMQSFVDYADELLYTPSTAAADEIVWPNCSDLIALRLDPTDLSPGLVHHSCVTGLSQPPTSNYVGKVVDLSFHCSIFETATEIKLRTPMDDVADTLGALFKDVDDVEIIPKVSNLIVTCSDTSAPTATRTASPTSTTTATPTPTPTATTTVPPPTETAAGAATPTRTPTATPEATATATTEAQLQTQTATATATATPTPTPTATFTPAPCPTDSVRAGGVCATITPTYTPTPAALVGDTSCDGVVNPLDAALILQLVAGLIPALPCPGGGDTDGDGVTNPLDAALVLQFSAGLIGSLPP